MRSVLKKRCDKRDLFFFIILVFLVLFLVFVNSFQYGLFSKTSPVIVYDNDTIILSELSLRQKIGQMLIVFAKPENRDWIVKNNIGGIWIFSEPSVEVFRSKIAFFQSASSVKLFVSTDLEGCNSPFDSFRKFKPVSEISSVDEAFFVGREHGEFLSDLGFNLNFAPVVDLKDSIWNCRSFNGSPEVIAELAGAYILGLREFGVLSTVKHFPGKTLESVDPHKDILFAVVSEKDVLPFLLTSGLADCIMISHQITEGVVDSFGKPAVVSVAVDELASFFDGLILTDEIGMLGLKDFYDSDVERFVDLFKHNNDVVLVFHRNTVVLDKLIKSIEKAVKKGVVSEKRIDNSVVKILKVKGYNVIV